MPQFGASLTDDARVVIYDRNMFIIQATGHSSTNTIGTEYLLKILFKQVGCSKESLPKGKAQYC